MLDGVSRHCLVVKKASYLHQTIISITTFVFIDFLQKLNHDFLQCFNVQLVLFTLQHTFESTKYNRKYTVHPKVHKCTFGCTVHLFPFPVEKYWFLRVNVPLGVLCTFKSDSTKYIRRGFYIYGQFWTLSPKWSQEQQLI